jgi:outer membrane lipoprotein SlyB
MLADQFIADVGDGITTTDAAPHVFFVESIVLGAFGGRFGGFLGAEVGDGEAGRLLLTLLTALVAAAEPAGG